MYTLGFPFQPWRGESSIASGEEIRDYVRQTAHEHGVTERTHFGQRVERLDWSSADARWTATTRTRDGLVRHTARFVYLATGYYSYESGHLVEFPGQEDFAGEVVHPQHWPEGMPVAGRRVVVVGSGATAITLLPALVDEGASLRDDAPAQPQLRRVAPVARRARRRPARRAAGCRGAPTRARQERAALDRRLPGAAPPPRGRPAAAAAPGRCVGCPTATPSTPTSRPRYDPWDQRLCVAPDGDLFDVLSDGRARVVTGTVERFERDGIRLDSGELLEADVIVTATGLQMQIGGGAELVVDGEPVDLSRGHVYKGLMLSDVPNVAMAVGYTNASWTLRADLSARWFCSLLRYLDRHDLTVATPRYDEPDGGSGRCSTSPRGTCSARRTCCRGRGSTGRGGWCRLPLRPRGHPVRRSTTATSSSADATPLSRRG